eukprot:193562_1
MWGNHARDVSLIDDSDDSDEEQTGKLISKIGYDNESRIIIGGSASDEILSQLNNLKSIEINNVYIGHDHFICEDSNNTYWVYGKNKFGQCGIGYYLTVTQFTQLDYFTLNNIKINKVILNSNVQHTFWISDKGRLYTNGLNRKGQLGLGDKQNRHQPTLVKYFAYMYYVMNVQMTYNFSLVICKLRNDMFINILYYWIKIKADEIPNDIITTIKMFYSEDKTTVYSTGLSPYCIGNKPDLEWKKIDEFKEKDIIEIASGESHSLFLENNGTIWCRDNHNDYISKMTMNIDYFKINNIKIVDIKCGKYHNLALDNNGNIHWWSGMENNVGDRPCFSVSKFQYIECGNNHSYCLGDDGKHFLLGSNKYNECTFVNSDKIWIKNPYCINKIISAVSDGKTIKKVIIANCNTYVLLADK